MRCKECGASDREGDMEGIQLECEACAMLLPDCRCGDRLDYLPHRWVHCLSCEPERLFISTVDTTKKGWRRGEV